MLEWRIYYEDGSTFSSEDGAMADAPAHGVIAIATADDPTNPAGLGRRIEAKSDFYLSIDGEWYGVDIFGVIQQFTAMGLLKSGVMTTRQRFREIHSRAIHDPEFPIRSAKGD